MSKPQTQESERIALDAQLEAAGGDWTELHYCINDFCHLLGIPFGFYEGWDEHQAIRDAVLDVFVAEAKKRGWRADA